MKRTARVIGPAFAVSVLVAGLMSPNAAMAHEPSVDPTDAQNHGVSSESVVIDGSEFGIEGDVEATEVTESYPVTDTASGQRTATSGDGSPSLARAATWYTTSWGASFARNREHFQLAYEGQSKAAANVYSGQRIVKVCFWWTRNSVTVSGVTCSVALSQSGTWVAGGIETGSVADSLDPNAPTTIFNIQTTRINPSVS